ncbi:MAG TPA: ribosome silencing factor [Chloroflexota bacterium]|nr:ribosome silencing factor [Chloroflexota bacterium]
MIKRRICRLESEKLARRIVDIASDKQATDVVMLSLRDVSLIADYFVICSGGSDRQIKAIADQITETLAKEEKVKPLQKEGQPDSGWVLLDYGSVIVHIFSQEAREFYRLEKVWSQAVPVLRIA